MVVWLLDIVFELYIVLNVKFRGLSVFSFFVLESYVKFVLVLLIRVLNVELIWIILKLLL